MHIHFLDPYRALSSPVHNLDGRVKFILTVIFILTTSFMPLNAWPVYILLMALLLSVEILSHLGIGYVWKRSSLVIPFMLAAVPMIFTIEGRHLFSISLGPWILDASVEGFMRLINVALKSWLSVQAAILLASSTPFPDLLVAMRSVHFPRLLVAMFGLMWRYLFVFADETLRLIRARASRSGTYSPSETGQQRYRTGGSIVWRGRVAGGMAGNLFLRAFERSDRIYVAMLSRGYDGEVRSLSVPALTSTSRMILICGLFLLSMLLALGILFWG